MTNRLLAVPTAVPFQKILHEALLPLGKPRQCALIDYPAHVNIGDHLIWAGTVDYLQNVSGTRIAYAADTNSFSSRDLNCRLTPADPILLHGGGNLGDLWPKFQAFHERVIAAHPERPIFLLPQSVYFTDAGRARRAANIFNSHGGLTIFVRDRQSFAVAKELFRACRVYLAPDMSFQMAGWFEPALRSAESVLLLVRRDKETATAEWPSGAGFIRQDWISFERRQRWGNRHVPLSRTVAKWHREGWLRRFLGPDEYKQRSNWLHGLSSGRATMSLAAAPGCASSLGLIWDACRQLSPHRALVTDRLHAHLLATFLGIPNVLRPNSYGKNKAFHMTWMRDVPWCRFAEADAPVMPPLVEAMAARPVGTRGATGPG